MSALTGIRSDWAIRRTAAAISGRPIRSWSAYPRDQAMPALVVATAGKPASSKTRALPTSHALGRTSRRERSWSCLRISAFALRAGGRLIAALPLEEDHGPVVGVRIVGGRRALERVADAREGVAVR